MSVVFHCLFIKHGTDSSLLVPRSFFIISESWLTSSGDAQFEGGKEFVEKVTRFAGVLQSSIKS